MISFKTEVGQSDNGFPCLYTALLPHKTIKKLHFFCTSSKQWILNSVATYNWHSLWHRITNICTDCVTTVWKKLWLLNSFYYKYFPGRPGATQARYSSHSKHFSEWIDLMVLFNTISDCLDFTKNWLRSLTALCSFCSYLLHDR